MPSIRALAQRFAVSAQTIQSALSVLEEEGLIRSASTRGYFVSDDVAENSKPFARSCGGSPSELNNSKEQFAMALPGSRVRVSRYFRCRLTFPSKVALNWAIDESAVRLRCSTAAFAVQSATRAGDG